MAMIILYHIGISSNISLTLDVAHAAAVTQIDVQENSPDVPRLIFFYKWKL